MSPLLIDKETHPIALAVLYRHPHLSYESLPLFARCAPLPARVQPGSKASMVRHLTIRASTTKPLIPPNYDPSTLTAVDYRSHDHTLPFYTIHPGLKDVCRLFPELNSFELVDTLLLHSDDAKLLIESLRSIRPRKARLEIRQWDLRSSPIGKELAAMSRPDIHGSYSGMPASPLVDPERHNESRGPTLIPNFLQASWKDALLNGGEVILPTWYIEPPPPPAPQNTAPAPVAPPTVPNLFSHLAMPHHNAGLGSRGYIHIDDDGDDDSENAIVEISSHQFHARMQQPAVGSSSIQAPIRHPNQSDSATATRWTTQPAPNASASIVPSADLHPEITSITSSSETSTSDSDTGINAVPRANAPTNSYGLHSTGTISAAVPNFISPFQERGNENRVMSQGLTGEIPMTGISNESHRTANANTPLGGDFAGPTALFPRNLNNAPLNATMHRSAIRHPQLARPESSSSSSNNHANGHQSRSRPLMAGSVRHYDNPIVNNTGSSTTLAPAPRALPSTTDHRMHPIDSRWPIKPQGYHSDQIFRNRMDHLYATDEDMQAAVFASYSPDTISNSLNRQATTTGNSSFPTIPIPRRPMAINTGTLDGEPIGIPTPSTVHALSYHLSHEMRRMLEELLSSCWCPRLEAFSFVALDPLASVIVRHPRVELWVQLPIPHIRVHLPRGVSSLAVFKGVKELARESHRRGRRAGGSNDSPVQQADVETVLEQMKIVAGDGEGRDLIHPSTRLFEIEVNTIAEMNDEREWIGGGDQLPSQLCRILAGTNQWRDVVIGQFLIPV